MTTTLQVYASHPTLFIQTRLLTSTGISHVLNCTCTQPLPRPMPEKKNRILTCPFTLKMQAASGFQLGGSSCFWLATYYLTLSIISCRLRAEGDRARYCSLFPRVGQAYAQRKCFQRPNLPDTITPPECPTLHTSSPSFPSKCSRVKPDHKITPCSPAAKAGRTKQHPASL